MPLPKKNPEKENNNNKTVKRVYLQIDFHTRNIMLQNQRHFMIIKISNYQGTITLAKVIYPKRKQPNT